MSSLGNIIFFFLKYIKIIFEAKEYAKKVCVKFLQGYPLKLFPNILKMLTLTFTTKVFSCFRNHPFKAFFVSTTYRFIYAKTCIKSLYTLTARGGGCRRCLCYKLSTAPQPRGRRANDFKAFGFQKEEEGKRRKKGKKGRDQKREKERGKKR